MVLIRVEWHCRRMDKQIDTQVRFTDDRFYFQKSVTVCHNIVVHLTPYGVGHRGRRVVDSRVIAYTDAVLPGSTDTE